MFFLSDTMKLLIVFALAFATVLAKDLYSSSIEVSVLKNEGRIFNGKIAAEGQFYYQVGITFIKGLTLIWCGGSFIGNNWILTAAHCISNASSSEVYLGATQRLSAEKFYHVLKKDMIIHPAWNSETIANDIGLLRIPTTNETSKIGIVRIPSNNNDKYIGEIVVIAGWGYMGDKSKVLSNHLRYATLKVSSGIYCLVPFELFYEVDRHICVPTANMVSPCSGDSGGPLVLEEQNLQIGVYSFGSIRGCEKGLPLVFTRVSAYLSWIQSRTGIDY